MINSSAFGTDDIQVFLETGEKILHASPHESPCQGIYEKNKKQNSFINHLNRTLWPVKSIVERTGNLTAKIAAIFCKRLAMCYIIRHIML